MVPNQILTFPKMYRNLLRVVPYRIYRSLINQFMKCTLRSAFRCNDYIRNEVFHTFYEGYLIKLLEEESKSFKNKLIGDIKTQLKVIENLSRCENRHCQDSVNNKDKMNVNYKSDDLKKEIQ